MHQSHIPRIPSTQRSAYAPLYPPKLPLDKHVILRKQLILQSPSGYNSNVLFLIYFLILLLTKYFTSAQQVFVSLRQILHC